ncbi:MAG: hypothetical protein ABIA21_03775, partial [Candidatus Aenigmatarchaeota archaeon]
GAIRIVLGYTKVFHDLRFNKKLALQTIVVSLFIGAIAAILIRPDEWWVAVFAGFGGHDVINAVYQGTIRKETGITPKVTIGSSLGGAGCPVGLSSRQQVGYVFVSKNGKITNDQYSDITKCSHTTASVDLRDLVKRKILKRYGAKKGTYYKLS